DIEPLEARILTVRDEEGVPVSAADCKIGHAAVVDPRLHSGLTQDQGRWPERSRGRNKLIRTDEGGNGDEDGTGVALEKEVCHTTGDGMRQADIVRPAGKVRANGEVLVETLPD